MHTENQDNYTAPLDDAQDSQQGAIEHLFAIHPELGHLPEEERLALIDKLSPEQVEKLLTGGINQDVVRVYRENRELETSLLEERKKTLYLIVSLSFLAVLLSVMVYLWMQYPKTRVVQTVDNSVICEIDPQNNPLLTDVALEDFAKGAVLAVYNFDYINWQDQLNNATRRWFTSTGRAKFNDALKQSGAVDHIVNNNLIMKSFTSHSPQLEEKGLDSVSGKAYWIVRVPIKTEFYAGQASPVDAQSFIAQVRIIVTKRDVFNPSGLGVSSLTLRPDSSSK